jgi:ribose/xylose/arabinose/galactoside ABC-type transport system permease subunit
LFLVVVILVGRMTRMVGMVMVVVIGVVLGVMVVVIGMKMFVVGLVVMVMVVKRCRYTWFKRSGSRKEFSYDFTETRPRMFNLFEVRNFMLGREMLGMFVAFVFWNFLQD